MIQIRNIAHILIITSSHSTHSTVTYRLALLVLASVQHSPVDLSRVPLGQESRLAFGIQKLEHLMNTGKHTLEDLSTHT